MTTAQAERIKDLIRRELCVGHCHVQMDLWRDERRLIETCKERNPKVPLSWCEGCVRTLLYKAEIGMRVTSERRGQ